MCPVPEEDILITSDGEFGAKKFIQIIFVKLTLTFQFLLHHLLSPNQILYLISSSQICIFLFKRYKSFLLWSLLQIFILF